MKVQLFTKSLLAILLTVFSTAVVAQTGPAGVGNASGSSGQPQNVLWLDANTLGLSDGDPVTIWSDQSGNGYTFGASTGNASSTLGDGNTSQLPSFESDGSSTINGFPIIRFDDTNAERLVINPFSGFPSSDITTIIILKTANSSEGIVSYNVSGSGGDNEYLIFDANAIRTYVDGDNSAGGDFNTPSSESIFLSRWTNTDGTVEHYKNGLQVHTGAMKIGATISDNGSLAIGGEQDNVDDGYATNQDFGGDIAEMIIYGSYLNDAQRTLVENYLSEKYAITLDVTATDIYGTEANFSTAYIYDIVGVGKNGMDVHSESVSAGVYLEVVSTASLNDGDYVMLGHSNGGNASSTTDLAGTSPTITDRWERDWYVEKTSATTVGSNIYLEFDFPEGVASGQYPQTLDNYYLLYRSGSSGNYSVVSVAGKTKVNGDRVQFELTEAQLANGYYTLGTSDDGASPILGGPARTWYSYGNGNWSDANTWTLDGSAFPDYDNTFSEVPSIIDDVVITDSKVVTIQGTTNNLEVASLEVIGTLDLTSSSGHNFTTISGAGTLRLQGASGSANFATADITNFADASTGGTVEIYGSGLDLNQPLALNNLIINLDNSTDVVDIMADYTLNGGLDIQVGTLRIDDGTAGADLNLAVYGDVLVQNNGNIRVGSANHRHQINLYGDFTNQGTAYFTNRTSADYTTEATDGVVDLNFLNRTTDQQIQCDGECRFYRIEIDKAELTDTNATYILDINASSTANFNLFGYAAEGHANVAQLTNNSNALGLLSGTVRINTNVVIDQLNNTGNYNISERARIWVNGGEARKTAGSSTVPYGTVQVSGGTLESDVTSGVTIRDNGQIVVEGGQLLTRQIRTSILGPSNVGGYTQTGGSVVLDGTGGTQGDYSMFSMTYPQNVFSMSGGTLTIRNTTGNGVIFINSDSYNVTGGEVVVEINNNSTTEIDSKAPLYDLTLENTDVSGTGMEIELVPITGEGSEDETVGATELYILHDLRLASSAGSVATQLDPRQVDILIGGDLYLEQGSNLQSPSNEEALADNGVIKFIDSGERVIDLDNQTSTVSLQYLTVAKDNSTDKVTVINAPATALQIAGEFRVERGTFEYSTYTIEAQDALYLTDTIGTSSSTGKLVLNGSAVQTITTNTSGGTIHSVELDNGNNFTLTGGDLTVVNQLDLTNGVLDIGTNGLILQGSLASETKTDYSATRMIQLAGNASDNGFSRLITADGSVLYPIGTDANSAVRYTPALATFSSISDDGYVSIRPVDNVLATTETTGGDILSYYWNVENTGFSSAPIVIYQFDYTESDLDGSTNEGSFVPGKVLDQSPFTRSYEDDGIPENEIINGTNNIITFNGGADTGFTIENANYTAGANTRFVGTPTIYYTRKTTSGDQNWSSTNSWSTVSVQGAAAGSLPGSGDVVIIGAHDGGALGYSQTPIRLDVDIDTEVARLEFEEATGSEARGRLFPQVGTTHDWDEVVGNGEIQLFFSNSSNVPTWNTTNDFGDFLSNANSTWNLAHQGSAGTTNAVVMPSFPSEFPNLRITATSGGNGGTDDWGSQRIVTFTNDIQVNNDLQVANRAALWIQSNITVVDDMSVGVGFGHGRVRFDNGDTPYTLSVGGDITIGGTTGGTVDDSHIDIESTGTGTAVHYFNVGGNIILTENSNGTDGILDIRNTAADDANVVLELAGTSNASLTNGTNQTPSLYSIVMNKGVDTTYNFSFNSNFTLANASASFQPIELQNGVLILNDPNISVELTTNSGDFAIPGTAGLEIQAGTAFVSGDDTGISLDGLLRLSSANAELNMDISDGSNPGNGLGENGNNYIEYSSSGNAKIEISSGTLTVGSQIRRGLFSSTGILDYTQTGGTVVIGKNVAPEEGRGLLEVLNDGSNFTHTGGGLTLVRQNGTTPTSAALYLDPDTYDLMGSTITIGNTDTPAGQNDFLIYSAIPLNNLTIDGANSPTAKINVVPLSIDGTLTVASSNTLDGNGLQLTISGDFTNNGTYTPSGNITEFNATSGIQTLSGSGTSSFYDLVKSGSSTLAQSGDITVTNDLTINSGSTINTAAQNLNLAGNATIDGAIISDSGPTYNGLVFNGSIQQTLRRSSVGSSSIDIITINNTSGVKIPEASSFTFAIGERIQLEAGIFDIGGSSVELAQDADITTSASFGTGRMIVTNSADADMGLKKTFAAGTSDASLADNQFIFPIGQDVYSPFTVDISGGTMGTTSGTVLVKPVDASHPTKNNGIEDTSPTDLDNVLQYYWTVTTDNINDFTGDFSFVYDQSDVSVDDPSFSESDYITARIRSENNPSGDINKNDGAVDTGSNLLTFGFSSSDSEILSADYFVGVDDAIPNQVPTYTVTGIGGDIDAAIYSPAIPGGSEPKGAIVVIPSGATLTLNKNGIRLYQVQIQNGGVLDVSTTTQHNLREVTGTGTLRVEGVILPAASYDFSCSGLGIEYAGSSDYGLFSGISSLRRVIVSGTGTRTFSKNMQICGDFTVNGPTVQFTGDYLTQVDGSLELTSGNISLGSTSDLEIAGDLTLTAGSFTSGSGSTIEIGGDLTRSLAAFTASNGTVLFNGSTSQQVVGDFTASNAFRNVTINNTGAGVTIIDGGNNDIYVNNTLTLTDGLLTTDANNTLTVSATSTVMGGGVASFVNGPLTRENISASVSYEFKVGKDSRYAPATIMGVGSGGQNWTAEYFTVNANDPTSFDGNDTGRGSLEAVSGADMWTITSSGSNSAQVQLTYGSHTGVTNTDDIKAVIWSGTQWLNEGGTVSGTVTSGMVTAEVASTFSSKDFSIGTTGSTPLPVEFLEFNTQAELGKVQLSWKTASEINNELFEIQRSEDGKTWDIIGTVAGAGNSIEVLTYEYTDENPIVGISYYRLRQIDFDGRYNYSKIRSVEVKAYSALNTSVIDISLFPNPSSGSFTLNVSGLPDQKMAVAKLLDVYGKVHEVASVTSGELARGIKLNRADDLPAGLYFVNIRQDNISLQRKLIIQ